MFSKIAILAGCIAVASAASVSSEWEDFKKVCSASLVVLLVFTLKVKLLYVVHSWLALHLAYTRLQEMA